MNQNNYIDIYFNDLKNLSQSFVLTESQRKFERYFSLDKEDVSRNLNAYISINRNLCFMRSFNAGIAMKNVEDVLVPIFIKHTLLSKEFLKKNRHQYTFFINGFKGFYPFKDSLHYFQQHTIRSDNDAKLESKKISTFWMNLVLPFFSYFTSITELIPYIYI